jgi:hypothetical protein
MASPAALYFAGIGTVVGAISIGFAGALVLTSTQPVHKEPAAGFARRDPPVEVKVPAPHVPETTGQAPSRAASFDITPATPTKVEEVVGLQFAPAQPQANDRPAPRVIAPDSTPTRAAAAPAVKMPVVEPTIKPASDKPSDAVKTDRKLKREQYRKPPTALAEKTEPVRKQFVERRKKQIDVAIGDDEPIRRANSFASEQRHPRGGEGFFSFLFGN